MDAVRDTDAPRNLPQIRSSDMLIKQTVTGKFLNFFLNYIFLFDTHNVTRYNINMIKSFAHKGLREFYESGSKKGIQPEHAPKLGRMLDRLDASISPQDMNLPGYRLHPLKGDKQDMWAVTVNGNWRLTFYFEGQDAYLLDYQDYH